MNNFKICSCFGHRQIKVTETLETKLFEVYTDLIVNQGYNIFYFGGYGKFDSICHSVLREMKMIYKHIKLIIVRPYYENLGQNYIDLYKKEYDDCIYLPLKNEFGKLKIIYRNYAIIDKSDLVLFYIRKTEKSGAYNALCYAQKKHKKVVFV